MILCAYIIYRFRQICAHSSSIYISLRVKSNSALYNLNYTKMVPEEINILCMYW